MKKEGTKTLSSLPRKRLKIVAGGLVGVVIKMEKMAKLRDWQPKF